MFKVLLLVFNLASSTEAPIPVAGFDTLQDCERIAATINSDPDKPKDLVAACYMKPVKA